MTLVSQMRETRKRRNKHFILTIQVTLVPSVLGPCHGPGLRDYYYLSGEYKNFINYASLLWIDSGSSSVA